MSCRGATARYIPTRTGSHVVKTSSYTLQENDILTESSGWQAGTVGIQNLAPTVENDCFRSLRFAVEDLRRRVLSALFQLENLLQNDDFSQSSCPYTKPERIPF